MSGTIRLACALVSGGVLLAIALGGVAAYADAPGPFIRCAESFRLWTRYETAHCPNQSGQRAQAEWAFYRCQQGDFDRGLRELDRLLRRDLINIPSI